MGVVWIICLAMALSATQAQGQYFPKSSVDLRGDEFKNKWYSSQLRALQEPSLSPLTKTPSSESYRFLWLRTFNHPVTIRLDPKPDGTGVLTTKVANGSGGFRPGVLIENTSKVLTKEQTQEFLSRVNKLNFWTAPNPVDDQKGTDGSQWIIEGVKGGQYHVVDRWLPRDGIARELGMMLVFDLARMSIPKGEIY
jgi:hypothetical protein